MNLVTEHLLKKNVKVFESDVKSIGGYQYTRGRLSSSLANQRISEAIWSFIDFEGARILDIGCGDGSYTFELARLGATYVLGIDPAMAAIEVASGRAKSQNLSHLNFEVAGIIDARDILRRSCFDYVILRGVLHHLSDPVAGIESLRDFQGKVIVLEPNGYNPVVKFLEKFSRYHIEHEERSFGANRICSWLSGAGFLIDQKRFVNLVPFFCPDLVARILFKLQNLIERIPILRLFVCGQVIIVAKSSIRSEKRPDERVLPCI